MKNLTLFLILISYFQIGFSQNLVCSPQDKETFKSKIEALSNFGDQEMGTFMVTVGKSFIETLYKAKTLEIGESESLVINLQGLDCTTFVENVLAFSLMLQNNKKDFDSFVNYLKIIRYKNGELNGYASRLHYFSEWIANNENKGFIKDMTSEIGGFESTKDINFMSSHRELYPFLKDDENYQRILTSERLLKLESICILPQEQIQANEHLIKSGDIIALTTSIKGLDITHTGIATREADDRIHLLHASTEAMKVEVSKLPLTDYLKGIKSNTGIMVARPL